MSVEHEEIAPDRSPSFHSVFSSICMCHASIKGRCIINKSQAFKGKQRHSSSTMGWNTSGRDLTSQQAHVHGIVDVIANNMIYPTAIASSANPIPFLTFPVPNQHSPFCVLARPGIQLCWDSQAQKGQASIKETQLLPLSNFWCNSSCPFKPGAYKTATWYSPSK